MRFAFFGTPYVARDTLAFLCEHGFTPTVVVTNPDAPKGRGQVLTPSETKVFAEAHGIPVLTPERLDENAIRTIASYGCELAVVVAYGSIFPRELIGTFPKGAVNVHYSLLPKYRGAAPVEAALLHDERETGVSIQQMAERLDAGDILLTRTVAIADDDTTPTLRARLIAQGAEMLVELLPKIASGTVTHTPQDEHAATYAPKLKKEDAEIRLDAPARENWNKYRAFKEWSPVFFYTERNGASIRVKVTDAALAPDGTFTIRRVIPEGRKEMDYETFARTN